MRSTSPEVEALTLSPDDLLLHLSAHTCVHHVFDNGLTPFVDFHQTLTRFEDTLDWEWLWHRAGQWGLERPLCVMLMMTEWLLGWSAPECARCGIGWLRKSKVFGFCPMFEFPRRHAWKLFFSGVVK